MNNNIDLDKLEALAKAATPGPWRECGHDRGGCKCALIWCPERDELVAEAWKGDDMVPRAVVEPAVNAAYIAAANPAAILELIALARAGSAAPAAPTAEQDATDIARRLRARAAGAMSNQDDAKLMMAAADECDRFYNGMMNWKANAQAKDRTIIEQREALAAPTAAVVPSGYKLVPIETTGKMDKAGREALRNRLGSTVMQDDAEACYRAMLAAAPAATPPAGESALTAMSQAARDVLAERRRQVEAEGWTPEHDDEYDGTQMARAAACYLLFGHATPGNGWVPHQWPWDREWWKPSSDRRNLIKAAALVLADIERIDRAAIAATPEQSDTTNAKEQA